MEKYPQGQLASRLPYFILPGSSQELRETAVKPLVEQCLQERGLELSEEKTPSTHLKDGFEFLGQQSRQYKDKILVKPSRKRVHTLLTKVRALIKTQAQATTGNLSSQLNPLMRGWAD